jgi:hypothetical protein
LDGIDPVCPSAGTEVRSLPRSSFADLASSRSLQNFRIPLFAYSLPSVKSSMGLEPEPAHKLEKGQDA